MGAKRSRRGFASWPKDKAKEVQAMGGAAGGHRFTATEARKAAVKGGASVTGKIKREAGRKGGLAKAARRRALLAADLAELKPEPRRTK